MKLTFEEDGITYTWIGGFGALFSSQEKKLQEGTTRVIGKQLFYVYSTYSNKVNWLPYLNGEQLTWEWIQKYKEKLIKRI